MNQGIDTKITSHGSVTFQHTPTMEMVLRNILNLNIPYRLWNKLQSNKKEYITHILLNS